MPKKGNAPPMTEEERKEHRRIASYKWYVANREKANAQAMGRYYANVDRSRAKQREKASRLYHANLSKSREKAKASGRKRREANPEKVREYRTAYRAANREKIRKRDSKWRNENQEKVRELCSKWRAANSEKVHEYDRVKRLNKKHKDKLAQIAAEITAVIDRLQQGESKREKANRT